MIYIYIYIYDISLSLSLCMYIYTHITNLPGDGAADAHDRNDQLSQFGEQVGLRACREVLHCTYHRRNILCIDYRVPLCIPISTLRRGYNGYAILILCRICPPTVRGYGITRVNVTSTNTITASLVRQSNNCLHAKVCACVPRCMHNSR